MVVKNKRARARWTAGAIMAAIQEKGEVNKANNYREMSHCTFLSHDCLLKNNFHANKRRTGRFPSCVLGLGMDVTLTL